MSTFLNTLESPITAPAEQHPRDSEPTKGSGSGPRDAESTSSPWEEYGTITSTTASPGSTTEPMSSGTTSSASITTTATSGCEANPGSCEVMLRNSTTTPRLPGFTWSDPRFWALVFVLLVVIGWLIKLIISVQSERDEQFKAAKDAQKEIEDSEKKVEESKKKVQDLENETENLKTRVSDRDALITRLQNEVTSLELAAGEALDAEDADENWSLKQINERLMEELKAAQSIIDKLDGELENANPEITTLRLTYEMGGDSDHEDANAENTTSPPQANTSDDDGHDMLQLQLASLQEDLRFALARLRTAEGDLENWRARCTCGDAPPPEKGFLDHDYDTSDAEDDDSGGKQNPSDNEVPTGCGDGQRGGESTSSSRENNNSCSQSEPNKGSCYGSTIKNPSDNEGTNGSDDGNCGTESTSLWRVGGESGGIKEDQDSGNQGGPDKASCYGSTTKKPSDNEATNGSGNAKHGTESSLQLRESGKNEDGQEDSDHASQSGPNKGSCYGSTPSSIPRPSTNASRMQCTSTQAPTSKTAKNQTNKAHRKKRDLEIARRHAEEVLKPVPNFKDLSRHQRSKIKNQQKEARKRLGLENPT